MNIESYIDGIEKRASESIKAEQGDYYGEDGLLVCGKCHTPKQTRVFIFDRERTPMCLCKCEVERRDREETERKRIEFENRVRQLRAEAFPEIDLENWNFSNDDEVNSKVTSIMKNFVENFDRMRSDGKGLLLFGPTGTGKTFASACVANALIDRGIPVLMTNFKRIANMEFGLYGGKQKYYDSLNQYPLLILDDLGVERKSEYMQEIVYEVINSRYLANLPLIVTTNLTRDELKFPAEMTNQRTFSRLFEMCIPIEVTGGDRRREKLKDDMKEYKDVLGL